MTDHDTLIASIHEAEAAFIAMAANGVHMGMDTTAFREITPRYFSRFDHMAVWKVLCECFNERGTIDTAYCLNRASSFRDKFMEIMTRMDRGDWRLSKIELDNMKKNLDMQTLAREIIHKPENAVEYYEKLQAEIEQANAPGMVAGIKEHLKSFVALVSGRMAGEYHGVLTGFQRFDDATCGLVPQRLNIVAARPKVGKTALALQWGYAVSTENHNVLYISTEMSANELLARLIGSIYAVPSKDIQTGRLSEKQFQALISAVGRIQAQNTFHIVEMIGATAQQIIGVMRKYCAKVSQAVVIIDQLQGIHFTQRYRVYEIGDALKAIRTAGVKLNTSILMLCQLSRSAENRESGRPGLADLRDSGEIEQDADVVVFLWRQNKKRQRMMTIAANRHGPAGEWPLGWDSFTTRFYERTTGESDDEPISESV